MTAHEIKACSIDGCGRPVLARGWCEAHYARWLRTGDVQPDRPIITLGAPEKYFYEVVMRYEGDECLPWPFARNSHGYAHGWIDGALRDIYRLVCERAYGAAPTPEHEAAHLCGKGNLGCVAKRHLSWATHKENESHKLLHGTHGRGERNSGSKLTEQDVREIRELRGKVPQRVVAARFGIVRQVVSGIQTGRYWGWLK